jgi:glutathione S-transferase
VSAYTLDWAHEAGVLGESPNALRYMERLYERPAAPMRIAAALASIGQ